LLTILRDVIVCILDPPALCRVADNKIKIEIENENENERKANQTN